MVMEISAKRYFDAFWAEMLLVRASGIFVKIHQQIQQVLEIKTPIFSHTKGAQAQAPPVNTPLCNSFS